MKRHAKISRGSTLVLVRGMWLLMMRSLKPKFSGPHLYVKKICRKSYRTMQVNYLHQCFQTRRLPQNLVAEEQRATYLISDGIGPEMHSRLVQVMQQQCLSILIDESKKYLNILVRYFNPILQKPETQVIQNCRSAW